MPDKLKKQERQMMLWESDDRIVPLKSADQADGSKLGNSSAGKAVKLTRDPDRAAAVHRDGQPLITRLDRITQVAERDRTATFNNLYTMLDYELLYEAFCMLKRDKAPGVDGVTVDQYGDRLIENLRDLETRLHRQSYRPQPSLRRDIPKGNGKTRPLGIAIEGQRVDTDGGVAQGSVLSPLLANVYLHYVLDQWFQRDVKPRLKGESHIVRYADDFICAFENETDARRFQEVLRKRLARFSLELAEEKTKLIRFGRFASRDNQRAGDGAAQTFDFLGFTHYCGRSREGKFKLKRMTSKKKFQAKVQGLKDWFRASLTTPITEVWQTLNAKLSGHYHYYNVNDNWRGVLKYREAARLLGLRWIRRRSQTATMSWPDYNVYLERHPLAVPGRVTDLIAMTRPVKAMATT